MPESMVTDLQDSTRELRSLLTSLRANVSNIRQQVADIRDLTNDLPPEAMDPQQAAGRSQPTSKATLEKLQRTVLTAKSSLLQKATVVGSGNNTVFNAVAADFGPEGTFTYNNVPLVIATPKTGGGTTLSTETQRAIRESAATATVICYMERGGGTTFVQKALAAQDAGASAVIIGNNTSASWPYIMKDSTGLASPNLKIPVVMIRQSDAQALVGSSTSTLCSFCLERNTNTECIICVESMAVGQTVIQLSCQHVFHESCAMQWLTQHHSCPYCRHELPTDDAELEADRRRRQGGTNGTTTTAANGDAFYG